MSGLVIYGVEVWRLLLLGLVIGLVGVAAAEPADHDHDLFPGTLPWRA